MLTALTLFLLSASNELVGVTVLQKGCMDRFRNALNSSDPWVSIYVCKHSRCVTFSTWAEFKFQITRRGNVFIYVCLN